MKALVTIVFFEILGRRKYISDMSIRPDNTIVPIYTDDRDEAHQFADEGEALKKIGLFVNTHNREFKTENVEEDYWLPFPAKARKQQIERIK